MRNAEADLASIHASGHDRTRGYRATRLHAGLAGVLFGWLVNAVPVLASVVPALQKQRQSELRAIRRECASAALGVRWPLNVLRAEGRPGQLLEEFDAYEDEY